MAKLKRNVYWPGQSADISIYIAEYFYYAKYKSVTPEILFYLVIIHKSFQLLELDFINSFEITVRGNRYILNIINYLTRYIFLFALKNANAEDIIRIFVIMFTMFITTDAVYIDLK